ncbi:hypothetical protein AB6Q20_005352 [Salmonella enterica]|uniref:PH domain-containing protein n=1 Tax=Salmonella enterica TaxID=28901 RepID=A0A620CLA0_SALER|nr:hypothetical protein [Salmonella enterica]EDB4490563.1 hypothetical protein [Salmonella enterica subsp. enterica serovar Rubislaw]EEJ1462708.1 hypothetical protein [Salmonella enterica subsp. enterica serovar Virginia]EIQ2913957.1 hypothetical protein [Salmonella enterica]EKH8214400.1 hypothetical protein [Salmonella enterica]
MAAINIPDIYGRNYLINFDTVKYIQVSDNEECGDLIITFTDKSRQAISVGLDRDEALGWLESVYRLLTPAAFTSKNKLWR